jgi:hypothetical protein
MKAKRNLIQIFLLGAVLLLLPAEVQAQLTFTTNNGAITITGYIGNPTALDIPSITNGYPVTAIGTNAFYNCTTLTNVTIGTNVLNIEYQAFHNCFSLTSITIPNSVTDIGSSAFSDTSLTNVTIGINVTNIGDEAFAVCRNLMAITVDTNNPVYSSVAGVLFDKNQTTLIQFPGDGTGNYTILDSVTNIGDNAFFDCDSLTSVTIPNSVTSIGGSAFYYCFNLTNVTIGTNVTSIGVGAFQSCFSLTSVTIPNSVTDIGGGAFSSCNGLTNVTIGTNVTSIGNEAFAVCHNLMAIMVDTNNPVYSSVAGVLFDKNQALLIQYPEGETGSYTIPNSVTSIENEAFQNCSSLTSITIPNSVTNVANTGGNPILITDDGGAFLFCYSLMAITVDTNNPVYSSVAGVLFNKSQTMLIECPEGAAGNYTMPNSVTNVTSYAFEFCTNLTSVTIPNSVTKIGEYAFGFCTSQTVYFMGNAITPANDSSVFYGDRNGTVYYLPNTTGWGTTFDGLPTVLWNPQAQNDASLGVQSNQFGFNITGSSNLIIVVEACTNFSNPVWSPVSTNTLNTFVGTNGTSYFSDPQWSNYPARFYRLRSP